MSTSSANLAEMTSQNSFEQQTTLALKRAHQRELRRINERRRRQAMTPEQKQNYLARRREIYRARRSHSVNSSATNTSSSLDLSNQPLPNYQVDQQFSGGLETLVSDNLCSKGDANSEDISSQNISEDQHFVALQRARQRELRRISEKRRRHSMTSEQRSNYLARRREIYQARKSLWANSMADTDLGADAANQSLLNYQVQQCDDQQELTVIMDENAGKRREIHREVLRRERERELRRISERRRRQSMSAEKREAYLARRREIYRSRRSHGDNLSPDVNSDFNASDHSLPIYPITQFDGGQDLTENVNENHCNEGDTPCEGFCNTEYAALDYVEGDQIPQPPEPSDIHLESNALTVSRDHDELFLSDIPDSWIIDFGTNSHISGPEDWEDDWWGS